MVDDKLLLGLRDAVRLFIVSLGFDPTPQLLRSLATLADRQRFSERPVFSPRELEESKKREREACAALADARAAEFWEQARKLADDGRPHDKQEALAMSHESLAKAIRERREVREVAE